METNNNINITAGLYIPNIEASWLYKFNQEVGNYEVNEIYLDKLLNGKLDYSFELVENKKILDGIEIKEIDGKLYTLDIINVKYTRKHIKKEKITKKVIEELTTKELRDWTYKNGFKFEGKLMTNWKRSTGKSRKGENMFVLDSIKNTCLSWARMDLKFEGDVDIASIRAYESLPLSSIIGCIEINPKNILVIDDFDSIFDWNMSKTYLEDGNLKTETLNTKEKNSIWDGQGLLSNKIFDSNEIILGRGVALLRNRFMKCAGFCCYIEKFYSEYCQTNGLDYDTYEIEDMYGNMIFVKDIELITTPNAIKLKKYNDEVLKVVGYEGKGAWLKYWKERCGTTFGVCKTEKPSHFENGTKQVLSYQMVNTIPFTPLELKELVKPEIIYVERLKNDLDFFLQEVNQDKEVEIKETIETIDNEINENEDNKIEIGGNIDITGAFIELSKKKVEFQATQVFKDYRRNFISAYINKLRQGKIKIEADYCVACGNPIEMLLATVEGFDGKTSVLNDNELYCSRFIDGEDVIGFRNPHINVGNVGVQINKFSKEIHSFMNDTPNIVYLNSINYPILSTYQGEDFDIDANLLTNNKIIVGACKRIDKTINAIPVNAIKDNGKNDNILNGKNMSDIDHKISQNYIGSVINLSQEINSLYNHSKFNNLLSEVELNKLYNQTSRLSSISCCEIDKSKKQFEELDVPKELKDMKKGLKLTNDGRRIKPYFFKFIGDNASKKQKKSTNKKHKAELKKITIEKFAKDNEINIEDGKIDMDNKKIIELLKADDKLQEIWESEGFVFCDTPMDWLQNECDAIKNSKKVGTVQVIQLVKKSKHVSNKEVVDYIVKNIKELDIKIKAYKLNDDLNAKDKLDKIRFAKGQVVKNIKHMKLIKADLYGAIKECLNSCKRNGKVDKKSGIESLSLEILFKAYGTGLLDMFLKQ